MREEGVRIKERERERTMYMNVWPFCLFRLSQKRNKKKKYKEKYGEKFNSLDTLANERERERKNVQFHAKLFTSLDIIILEH